MKLTDRACPPPATEITGTIRPSLISTRADSFSPNGITLNVPVAVLGHTQFHLAAENVGLGRAGPIDLDAELGAQVGHGRRGSADDKGGRRKGEGGLRISDFGLVRQFNCRTSVGFFRLPPSAFPLCFHPGRQLAQREEAAGGRVNFIGARALENDFCPAVIADFHESRDQLVLAAQGDGRRGRFLRIGPAAIGQARDPADKLRRRR